MCLPSVCGQQEWFPGDLRVNDLMQEQLPFLQKMRFSVLACMSHVSKYLWHLVDTTLKYRLHCDKSTITAYSARTGRAGHPKQERGK